MTIMVHRTCTTDLGRALEAELPGRVADDAFTRGRHATDASIYQIMPRAVVWPRDAADVTAAMGIAAARGVPVIARGAGTSQNGQPLGDGIVLDFSRHFNAVVDIDETAMTARVQPGVVLDRLNAALRPRGLFFPVEPSTASRCTIGGMTGNNSCGARSLIYGKMVDNVQEVSVLLPDGRPLRLGPGDDGGTLGQAMARLAQGLRPEIEAHFPKVQRRVGGYNLDALIAPRPNPAHLLVGSEGTLALTTEVVLRLARLPARRVMGICHFPSFRAAMETTRHLVALGPAAVELVDNNVLRLGTDIPLFRQTLDAITRGTPDCLLLVEFAGDAEADLGAALDALTACMADHGYPDAVVRLTDPAAQRQVWDMREACLNIMMSAPGDAKPVSFIEDCAVPLEHLADYTAAITDLFDRHGTRGTWYAHASVGCLHVRPILNLRDPRGMAAMRAIAEEACALVRRFKGSHSGEHGDGISRSEFHEAMFGAPLVRGFEAVKDAFDPAGRLNPGKIVRPYRMDDPALMRHRPGPTPAAPATGLDWSATGGLQGAAEMCNNNGTCRKLAGGAMCPSYRATRDEAHLTRGRANVLRLALTGHLGPGAISSTQMKDSLSLCVGCKACRRECPTGVDMARMKIEVLHQYHAHHPRRMRDRLIGALPVLAPVLSRLRWIANLRDRVPGMAALTDRWMGLTARRPLPRWQKAWDGDGAPATADDIIGDGLDLVLFADTFTRHAEPAVPQAALRVLRAAGYRLHAAPRPGPSRPLCCGRTRLATGQIDAAKAEARRTLDALSPLIARGARVVGVEPSCILTLRDEYTALFPGGEAQPLAQASFLVEEVLEADLAQGRVTLPLRDFGGRVVHLHGHCHQKAFGLMPGVESLLRRIPGIDLRPIDSSCCGMAGAFGHQSETYDVSMAMAELSLLPAVRAAGPDDLIVADGTSCRSQIAHGAARGALHVAEVLEMALGGPGKPDH